MPGVVRRMAPQAAWESDNATAACFLCGKSFGALNRRHHCRECGRVVCNKCSDNHVAMTNTNGVIEQSQRCCDSCYRAQFAAPRPVNTYQPAAAPSQAPTASSERATEKEDDAVSENMASASVAAAEAAAAAATEQANARSAVTDAESSSRAAVASEEFDGRSTIVMARAADSSRIVHALARKRQISTPALTTVKRGTWAKVTAQEGIEVKAALMSGIAKKAAMASIDLPETDFVAVVSTVTDAEFLRKLEPTILSAESRHDPEDDGVSITVTKYKSSGIISARDFVTVTADHSLSADDCAGVVQLAAGESITQAYVHASTDYPQASQNAGFVRGTIHCHAYVAAEVVNQSGATMCRLVHVSHADPKGSIPAFALETTFGEHAKRLASIRKEAVRRTVSHRRLMKADALAAAEASAPSDRQIRSSLDARARAAETSNRHVDPAAAAAADDDDDESAAQAADDEGGAAADEIPEPAGDDRPVTTASPVEDADEAPASEDEEEAEEVEEMVVEAPPPPAPAPKIGLTQKKAAAATLMLQAHKSCQWRLSKTLDNCDLEDATVSYCDKKALRITTTIKASLATLEAFLSDASQLRKYDPTLDVFEVLPSPAAAADDEDATTVVYSSYKRATRLIAPRDFCVESAMARLHEEEAKSLGLGNGDQVVFVSAARNSKRKPDQKGYTRGLLHMYGFICVAKSFDTMPITVYNLMCVDPMGSIPTWLVDAAQAESCKKLAKIRSLVEERQRVNPAKPMAVAVPPPEPPVVTQKRIKKVKPARAAEDESSPKKSHESDAASPDGTQAPPSDGPSSPTATTVDDNDEDDDFHSCVDEEEYMAERQEMRNFHEEEVTRICSRLTRAHTETKWSPAKMVEGCKVQSAAMEGAAVKAQRISTEFKCSLEQFKSHVQSTRTAYHIDPSVETVEVLQSPPFGTVVYTSYKSGSRLLSDRDFCSLTATKGLSSDEGAALGLYTKGIHSSALVVSSVNSTDMPERQGYVRGEVIAYGYIVVATPPDARRVRVFHVACVDPKGSIPSKIIDAAVAETCKKVNRLRELCEESQAKIDAELRAEAAATAAANDAAAPAAPVERKEAPSAFAVVERPFLELQTNRKWGGAHQVGPCRVETLVVPGTDVTAHRASLEFKCSVATFEAVMNTTSIANEIDPTLEVVRVQESKSLPDASCVYTAYRSGSRLLASRDFCSLTTSRVLGAEQGSDLGLYTTGIPTKAYLNCSVDCAEVPAQKEYVRGKVLSFGYLALATPPNARRVRIFNIAAINPGCAVSPKVVKALVSETCAKLQRLRVICEEREAEVAMTLREVPEPELAPSAAASPQNASGADLAEPNPSAAAADDDEAGEPSAEAAEDGAAAERDVSPDPMPEAATSTESVASPKAAPSLESPAVIEPMPAGIRTILRPLLDLHLNCATWKKVKVLHECILEATPVSFSDKHAQRITTTVQCSLKTFMGFLGDERMLRKYDPTLAKVEALPSPDDGDVMYTAYKQATRLIAPRDFCTINTRVSLTPEVAEVNKIHTQGRHAIITNAIDSSAMPAQRGYVRGRIHMFGYFATADSFDSVPITVHNLMCVDPSGSIPNWVLDVAVTENIKKLAKVRELARSYHVALLNRRSSNLSN